MLEISHKKMGHATSISNIIRQLGGSFGVAILATVLTTRVNYHTQMYGESVQLDSQTLRNVTTHISYYLEKNAGSSRQKAQLQSRAIIASNLGNQAFIQGIDDDFLIAAIITVLGGIPVFFLHSKKKLKNLYTNNDT